MINRANQTMGQRLVQDLAALKREGNALKTRQRYGADNLVVNPENVSSTTVTLAANQRTTIFVTAEPVVPQSVIAEVAHSIFIGTDNDPDYLWPEGALLSTNDVFNTVTASRLDMALSDPLTGKKVYVIWILNTGGFTPKTYHIHTQFLVPGVEVTLSFEQISRDVLGAIIP